jgi:hypothetical protein
VAHGHFAAPSSSSGASAAESSRIVTTLDVTRQITALQKLVDTQVGSDQFLLKTIHDSVSGVLRRCEEKMIENNIASRTKGAKKYVSNIAHTKPKDKEKSEGNGRGTVFPDRGNQSPIGVSSVLGGVAKAKTQSHPGTSKHTPLSSKQFCEDCGRYCTSRCTLAVCHGS